MTAKRQLLSVNRLQSCIQFARMFVRLGLCFMNAMVWPMSAVLSSVGPFVQRHGAA
jgi:hypothetical protein